MYTPPGPCLQSREGRKTPIYDCASIFPNGASNIQRENSRRRPLRTPEIGKARLRVNRAQLRAQLIESCFELRPGPPSARGAGKAFKPAEGRRGQTTAAPPVLSYQTAR